MNPYSRPLVVPILAICLLLLPDGSPAASITPTSVTIGSGFTRDLDPNHKRVTVLPSLAGTWLLSPHLAVRASAAYLQERLGKDIYSNVGVFSVDKRSEHIPLGIGLRFYPGGALDAAPGLYLDAAPVIGISHLESYVHPDWNTVRWGWSAGVGVRFRMMGSARGELGATVHTIEGKVADDLSCVVCSRRRVSDLWIHAVTLSVGFGD
jgi:hypothetical protein